MTAASWQNSLRGYQNWTGTWRRKYVMSVFKFAVVRASDNKWVSNSAKDALDIPAKPEMRIVRLAMSRAALTAAPKFLPLHKIYSIYVRNIVKKCKIYLAFFYFKIDKNVVKSNKNMLNIYYTSVYSSIFSIFLPLFKIFLLFFRWINAK